MKRGVAETGHIGDLQGKARRLPTGCLQKALFYTRNSVRDIDRVVVASPCPMRKIIFAKSIVSVMGKRCA